MKKETKEKGITLIALVITIIILLILAGISIGMLSGDNSIINQAGNAKTQTDIAQEKEILEQATVVCMGKNKYGNIEETDLKKELENVAEVITSGSKFKVTFPSERQYLIDQDGNIKEKNPNAKEISELYDGASTYFGWDVVNYAETLPEELQDTEWQLFYAGTLDGETEERIYLISKGYVKNTVLPTVIKNGVEVEGAKPIPIENSEYAAKFGSNESDGVMPQYTGSDDIETRMQKYNKDYFEQYTSTNLNMKAVAYMLDTVTWSKFATSNKGYAEYAIGGPTLELLFTAYNKYKGTSYETQVSSKNGYKIKKDTVFSNYMNDGSIESDLIKENPYSVSSRINETDAYWIASPSNIVDSYIMYVHLAGSIYYDSYCQKSNKRGFRPMILLNSNYTLEKTKDSNGNDAFKIVEQ